MKTQMNVTADCCEKLSLMTCQNGIDDLSISEDMITINSKHIDIAIDYDFIEITQTNGDDVLTAIVRPIPVCGDDFISKATLPYTKRTDATLETVTYLIETDFLLFILELRNDSEADDLPIIALTIVIK